MWYREKKREVTALAWLNDFHSLYNDKIGIDEPILFGIVRNFGDSE